MTVFDDRLFDFAETDVEREVVAAVQEFGGVRKASENIDRSYGAVQKHFKRVKERAALRGHSPKHGWNKVVPDPFFIKRNSAHYDKDGKPAGGWVISEPHKDRQLEAAKEVIGALAEDLPRVNPRPIRRQIHDERLMTVIPIADPHIGMYSHHEESGANYSTDIAVSDTCHAVDYLVKQGPHSKRCLIINLGDWLHADNLSGVTEKSGNVLDMDTRMPLVIRKAMAAMRQCVETALKHHEHVELMNISGNHDEILGCAFRVAFAMLYENEPRVTIHEASTSRQYIRFGKVLIGATHGHQTKDAGLPGIMAAEQCENWGQARFRYFYRGHHHQDDRKEFPGCVVEQFRNLAAPDAYAAEHGFLSGRDMKAIVMHRDYGEVSRITCALDMLRDAA